MKRFSALFIVLTLTAATLFAGCSAQETSAENILPQAEEETVEPALSEKFRELPPEDGMDFPNDNNREMPMRPEFPMDGSNTDTEIETLPPVESDNLFTERDLNCDPDLSDAISINANDNSYYTISSAGIYVLSGEAENFTVIVEADTADKVQIVLSGAVITNDDFPVIYVKSADKCFVTSLGENNLTVSGQFVSDGKTNTDAVIFSKDDLTLNGTGTLKIMSAAGNGISAKDDLKITGGKYEITSTKNAIEANDSISVYQGEFDINTNKDAFRCKNDDLSGSIYIRDGSFTINANDDGIQATTTLIVDGGEFNITAAEGMEATYVQINAGKISINASDDGINAARKSSEYDVVIEINGGDITIVMGPGDTDGLDANGTIIVNGGTIDVSCNSAFDSDRGSVYNGGTIIINGETVDSIPISMMDGRGGNKGDWFQDGRGGNIGDWPQNGHGGNNGDWPPGGGKDGWPQDGSEGRPGGPNFP